jgi:hypothetical protein
MSFIKNAFHRRTAARVRCGQWKPTKDEDHVNHHCDVFAGHLGQHRCVCGYYWRGVNGACAGLGSRPRVSRGSR